MEAELERGRQFGERVRDREEIEVGWQCAELTATKVRKVEMRV